MDGDSTVDLTVDPADLAEIRAARRRGSADDGLSRPDGSGWRDGRQSSDSALLGRVLGGVLFLGFLGLVVASDRRRLSRGVVVLALGRRSRLGLRGRGPGWCGAGGPRLADLDDLLLRSGPRSSTVTVGVGSTTVRTSVRYRVGCGRGFAGDRLHGGGGVQLGKRACSGRSGRPRRPAGRWRAWPPSIRSRCASESPSWVVGCATFCPQPGPRGGIPASRLRSLGLDTALTWQALMACRTAADH